MYWASWAGASPNSMLGPMTKGPSTSSTVNSSANVPATCLLAAEVGSDSAVVSPVLRPTRPTSDTPPNTTIDKPTVTTGHREAMAATRSPRPGRPAGWRRPSPVAMPAPNSESRKPSTSTLATPAASTAIVEA